MKPITPEAVKLFHEGTLAFAEIEAAGVRIDTDYVDKEMERVRKKVEKLERRMKREPEYEVWERTFGKKTNLDSPKQLAKILFEELGYEAPEETAKGSQKKTDKAVLSHIDSKFVRMLTEKKSLQKAGKDFLGLIRRNVCDDGRGRCFFNLHTVSSFRSSSDDWNFQNLPIRNEEMKRIVRRSYLARDENYQLVEMDFAQIEVRTACAYNQDPNLMAYCFDTSLDMHRDTAMQLFFLKKNQVQGEARHVAKNQFVFPQFYGSYYVECAKDIWESVTERKLKIEGTDILLSKHLRRKGIETLEDFEDHVREIERDFWKVRFKVYDEWKVWWWKQYLKRGHFKTLTGFYVDSIHAKNEVINIPNQGSAFHCMLWCVIKITKWLRKNKMKTKVIGQIHDSVVADVHKRERDDYLQKCKEVMTVDMPKHYDWINVPILVDAEVAPLGGSWFDKKKVAL